VLLQLYGFIIPAFSKRERQIALPLMFAVPFLFYGGSVFAYFVVLPKAIQFLQNFNADNFDIQLQAKDLYSFSVMVILAMGGLFQIPVALVALTSTGILSVAQLRSNRRIAVIACAFLAMILPGNDPVTMTLIAVPLYVLFEASIVLSALISRRAARFVTVPAEDEQDHVTTTDRDGD
jgi:sec-independent protein translocase protein TatC